MTQWVSLNVAQTNDPIASIFFIGHIVLQNFHEKRKISGLMHKDVKFHLSGKSLNFNLVMTIDGPYETISAGK